MISLFLISGYEITLILRPSLVNLKFVVRNLRIILDGVRQCSRLGEYPMGGLSIVQPYVWRVILSIIALISTPPLSSTQRDHATSTAYILRAGEILISLDISLEHSRNPIVYDLLCLFT